MSKGEKYSEWVCLDWYDGPLNEIAVVTFYNGEQMVECKTVGGWVGEEFRTGMNGDKFYLNHMRFTRETLIAMLDLLDGKPVKGFFDD